MMRTTSKLVKALAVLSALLPFCTSGFGQGTIVYDNSTTDLGRSFNPGNGVEFGDEITTIGSGNIVTDFKFQYFLSQNAAGGETAVLNFYKNDGPPISRTLSDGTTIQVPTPGTLLYTSPVLTLGTGFQTAEASGISVAVPNDFTWTVTFSGIGANETAGLLLYSPPTVGSSFSDFWQKNSGTWNTYLFDNGATPGNFAARVTAVPEPTTYVYALLAGLSWLGYLGFKRRSC
jgi:hypothetical protein